MTGKVSKNMVGTLGAFTGGIVPANSTIETSIQLLINEVNLKESAITTGTSGQYIRGDKTLGVLSKTLVGLPNVDNTSDLNKPISTATQTALNAKEPSLPTGSNNAQYLRGDKTWATLGKVAVGLANVDNTADIDKPVSTATTTALATLETAVRTDINAVSLKTVSVPLSPKSYGATGNGTTNDTAAFKLWAAALALTGAAGVIPAGRYKITETIDLRGIHLNIDCDPKAIFDFSTTVAGNMIKGAVFIVGGGDEMVRLANFSADIKVDDQTINFASNPGLSNSDIFIVHNSSDFSWSPDRDYYHAGEFMKALDVSGANGAVFTGSITGTTLTVTAMSSGKIVVGQALSATGALADTRIVSNGTGTGSTGTYVVSQNYSSALTSRTINGACAIIIDAPAACPYTVGGTMEVWKPAMKSVRWTGGQFIGNSAYGAGTGLMVFQADCAVISNVNGGVGNIMALVAMRRCFGGVIDSPVYWDASFNNSLNYSVNLIACHKVTVRNPFLRSARHGITFTGGSELLSIPNRFCKVVGGYVHGGLWALDMHGSNDRCGFFGVDAIGGIQLAGKGPWVESCFASGNMADNSDPGACIRTTTELLDGNISIKDVRIDDEGTKRPMILIQNIPSGGILNIDGVEFVANSTVPDFVVNVEYESAWSGSADVNISRVRGQSSSVCPIVQVTIPDGSTRHVKINNIDGASVRTYALAKLIEVRDVSSSDTIIEAVAISLSGSNHTEVVLSNIVGMTSVSYPSSIMVAVRGDSSYSGTHDVTMHQIRHNGLATAPVCEVAIDSASTSVGKSIQFTNNSGVSLRFSGRAEALDFSGNIMRNAVAAGIRATLLTHTSPQTITVSNNNIAFSNQCGMEFTGPGLGTASYLTITNNISINNNKDNTAASSNSRSSVRGQLFGFVGYHDNFVGDEQSVVSQVRTDAFESITSLSEYNNVVLGTLNSRIRTTVNYVHPTIRYTTTTYDPPSLTAGAGVTQTLGMASTVVGDMVTASFTQPLQDVNLSAWVSANGTISYRFYNQSSSTVDLPSGTVSFKVEKVG